MPQGKLGTIGKSNHVTFQYCLLQLQAYIFPTRPFVYLKLEQGLGVALLADCLGIQGAVESGQCLRQLISVQLVLDSTNDQMSPWWFCVFVLLLTLSPAD